MYNINYIESLISKEKYNNLFLKIIKFIYLLVHILIIALIVISCLKYEKVIEYDDKINTVKSSVLQKRGKDKINQVEKEWDFYYFRLTAIKELMQKSSKYGYIFKELGQYLPEDDYIISMSSSDKGTTIELYPKEDRLNELSSFYDYAEVLNESFEESKYMKKEFSVKNVKEEKLNKKTVSLLNLKI